jgi:hypothetical protein
MGCAVLGGRLLRELWSIGSLVFMHKLNSFLLVLVPTRGKAQ